MTARKPIKKSAKRKPVAPAGRRVSAAEIGTIRYAVLLLGRQIGEIEDRCANAKIALRAILAEIDGQKSK